LPASKDLKDERSAGQGEEKGKAKGGDPATRKRVAVRSEWDTSDEEDEDTDAQQMLPGGHTQKIHSPKISRKDDGIKRKLDFRAVQQDVAGPKLPPKDRSDPVKRALGPARKGVATKPRQ